MLDRIDRRILNQLQLDCSLTNLQLAEVVGLSPPACLKRVKRLTDNGFIDKKVALLAPDRFGPSLHMVVEVVMVSDQRHVNQEFVRRIQASPEVKQCYQVTGEVDFVLVVMVPDMPTYAAFCDRVLHGDPNMRKFRTLISMRREKYETAIDVGG